MTSFAEGKSPNSQHQPVAAAGPKSLTDLLALADPERTLVNWLLRQRGASLADIITYTQAEPVVLQARLDNLVAAGFLTLDGDADRTLYKPSLISRQPRTTPEALWKAVE